MHRILIALLLLAPAVSAGTADAPELADLAGDAGDFPCSDATDLQSFWVSWETNELVFHYTFKDLSVLESPAGFAQGAQGSCFWSYTDFQLVMEAGNLTAEVYMDYWTNPLYETGWRFYLHDSKEDLNGRVDMASNTIEVGLPYALIGEPAAGDKVGQFLIQVSNSFVGVGYDYRTDWAPNNMQPCSCWAEYGETVSLDDATSKGDSVAPVRAQAPAQEDSDAPVQAEGGEVSSTEPGVEAPGAPLMVGLAGIGAVAFLRRQSE